MLLKNGSKGEEVKSLQTKLGLVADGNFGPGTEKAIKEWQSGAITFEEMRAVLRKSGTATEEDAKAKEKIAQETAAAMALAQPDNVPGDGSTPPNNNNGA